MLAFFLTAGFLGMMYYFVPRQAQQPLWSYRFSIVNFWALISIYMWAAASPALQRAARLVQSVGMVFSVILLMPEPRFRGERPAGRSTVPGTSCGRIPPSSSWSLALVFYAASTLEGAILAIRSVNSLSHYTDWTIAHVHSDMLG